MQALVSSSRRHPRRLLLMVVITLAAASAFLAQALHTPRSAGAATLTVCGQTITASVTLTNDLDCDGGTAIHVGKANLTINLGGHTIGGVGNVGIDVGNFAHTTISGGTIANYDIGIAGGSSSAASLKVSGMRIEGSAGAYFGAEIHGAGSSITTSKIYGFTTGIRAIANGLKVTNNVLQANGTGISATNFDVTVSGNKVAGNGVGIAVNDSGISAASVITGNTVTGNRSYGIEVSQKRATITGNIVDDNGHNPGSDNGPFGINAGPGVGDDGKNTAKNNAGAPQCLNITCH